MFGSPKLSKEMSEGFSYLHRRLSDLAKPNVRLQDKAILREKLIGAVFHYNPEKREKGICHFLTRNITITDQNQANLLHILFRYPDDELISQMFKQLSIDTKSFQKVMQQCDIDGMNVLHQTFMAYKGNGLSYNVVGMINGMNNQTLFRALNQAKRESADTPLHTAFSIRDDQKIYDSLQNIMSRLSADQFFHLMSQKNQQGDTPLHIFFKVKHSADVHALLEQKLLELSPQQFAQLMAQKNRHADSPLLDFLKQTTNVKLFLKFMPYIAEQLTSYNPPFEPKYHPQGYLPKQEVLSIVKSMPSMLLILLH